MYAYGRSSVPITRELVYEINAPHVFGLRKSKPKPSLYTKSYGNNSPHHHGHGQQNDVFSWANSLSCISHPYTRRLNSEDTVEGGAVAMDRFQLVEEAGAAEDVAERNMTAEWAALTTGSAISKTIQVGVHTLQRQWSVLQ